MASEGPFKRWDSVEDLREENDQRQEELAAARRPFGGSFGLDFGSGTSAKSKRSCGRSNRRWLRRTRRRTGSRGRERGLRKPFHSCFGSERWSFPLNSAYVGSKIRCFPCKTQVSERF